MKRVLLSVGAVSAGLGLAVSMAWGQQEEHGRKYRPLPPTAHIVVTVEKSFNGKPLVNAAVIFHAVRNGQNDGNLEVKTDPEGRATIDVIEIGSQVTVQVIADGYATYAEDMNVDGPNKEMLVKMVRPRAQVSEYTRDTDAPAKVQPGVQEHVVPKPAAPPAPAGSAPATAAPPAGPAPAPPQ